jgi:hypothetical protein
MIHIIPILLALSALYALSGLLSMAAANAVGPKLPRREDPVAQKFAAEYFAGRRRLRNGLIGCGLSVTVCPFFIWAVSYALDSLTGLGLD